MKTPDKKTVLQLLTDSPVPLTRREMVDAFGLKGEDQRILLKRLLKDLEAEHAIVKQAGQAYAIPDALEGVGIMEVTGLDRDGHALARPVEWDEAEKGPAPRIEVVQAAKMKPMGKGDRALARFIKTSPNVYTAQIIRALDNVSGRVLGLIIQRKNGYILSPTDKKAKFDFDVENNDLNGAKPGDLVIAEIQPARGQARKKVRIREIVGNDRDPKSISLIALHEAGLRTEFPDAVIKETKGMTVPPLGNREDLRDIPLVTIDGADARDFDDAVFAEKDGDGFHLIVAIADVSYYVRPETALDDEAYRRGNSTYFPDRVLPMLPEALSNDLCSLRPDEDRACLAAHMWINGSGKLERYKFVRALMNSKMRFTYELVQEQFDAQKGELLEPVIKPLYAAYDVLVKARMARGALELDIPERKIILNGKGEMIGLKPRARLESHKLIEEFMVLANVAAAMALEAKNAPCVYRIHDRPSLQKMENVTEFIESFGLSMPKGQVTKSSQINDVLLKASTMDYGYLIHEMLLRSQMQAAYSPENIGHFGLALERYAHFTSPIRRYADLLVHRSLTRAYKLGEGGLTDMETSRLEEMSEHISETERLSAQAERATIDRFAASFLSEHVGATFQGRISGVTSFGLFVKLTESGADGIVPIRSLPDDYYIHDEKQHALIGRRNRLVYRLGAQVSVALVEADPVTGGCVLEILGEGADLPGIPLSLPSGGHGRGGPRRDGNRNKNRLKDRPPGRSGPDRKGGKSRDSGKKRPGKGKKR